MFHGHLKIFIMWLLGGLFFYTCQQGPVGGSVLPCFLIFCLVLLSIAESEVLKSPTIVVDFSFTPFSYVIALCIF